MHPYTCMHSRINIFMHAGVYIWINIPSGRQIPIIMLFIYFAKALRPLGLAVTASDYLDSMQIDTSASDVLERCLQRYMMNPSLCQLENLDPAAISGFGRSTRLRDRILERQHSLGVHFTRQALEGLCESYEGWASWTVRAKRFCLSNLPLSPPCMFFQFLQMTFMCSTCFDAGDPLHSLVRACDHGSEVAQTPSSFSISESSESIFQSSSSCSPDGLGSRLADS